MRDSLFGVISRAACAVAVVASVVGLSGATKGPDAGGYLASDAVVSSFLDLSGQGGVASVLAGMDDGMVALTMPFPFRFYGRAYTLVCVSANGAIYFVDAAAACGGFTDFANTDLTSTPVPHDLPAALPLWSDLTFQVAGSGSVLYQTLGAAGSRRFVVQWNNAYPQGSPNPVTFQVVLSESTNQLLFQYKAVALGAANPARNGAVATVGIRNAGSLSNLQQTQWSFDAPVIGEGSALQFSAPTVVGDVDRNGVVTCADLAIVKASLGKRAGEAGFDPRADLNGDHFVNGIDLSTVVRAFPDGPQCH